MVDYSKFEELNVKIVGIGATNPFSQKTYADSLKLPYPLLSDYPDLKVIRRYGVLTRIGEVNRPVARGMYFLIDKEGIVRGRWPNPPEQVVPSEPFLEKAREIVGKL
jgi:peroxiredoxin